MHAESAINPMARRAWNILVAFLYTFNMLFGMVPPVAAQEPSPTVLTDKSDYQAGETVMVTGAYWQGDTEVHILVNDESSQSWQYDVTVAVDTEGLINTSFVLPDYFVAQYSLTATGVVTGRQVIAYFTDAPILALTKSASPLTYTAVGAVINFSYVLKNTSSVGTVLNGPFTVTDNKVPSVSCPATATLAVGASITCTGTYTITPADMALGYAVNTATASSSSPNAATSNADFRIVTLPLDCRNDSDGANDEPGQKDLTQECQAPSVDNPMVISWNWDVISMSGNNSADGCALFDTNNNGLANYAICVSWQNNRVMQAGYPQLYSCNDSRSDRCAGSAPLTISNGSACALELADDDPFPTGDSSPLDAKAVCSINLADVGGAATSSLIDVCSYPSVQPNSDPSDCVVISTENGNLGVIKDVVPDAPTTNWDITFTGSTPYAGTITGDGSTGIQTVKAGTYTITETAGTGTDLSLYDSTWACTVDGSPSTSGSGTTISGRSVAKGSVVICTFTNTRKTGSLEIKKDVVPDDTSTNWEFAVTGPTASTCSINGDGTCGAKTVFTGSYSITETAGAGTSLGDYGTSYVCTVNGTAGPAGSSATISGLTVSKSDVVVCTFTNSKAPGTLTVNKIVVPSADTGLFNLLIDGTAQASNVGSGGTTGAVAVSAGSHTVSETAGTSTDLNNYVSTITGDCDPSGTVSVGPNQAKTCTITNTRKGSIVIKKVTSPAGQAGDFTFEGAVSGTIQDGGQLTASNLAPGPYTVTETSLASDFTLESIACDDSNSTGDVAAKKAAITLDAGETVTCTFTNKKLTPDLAVTKTADAAAVTAGDAVGFSISVKNNGAGTAYNVTLSDLLPAIPGVTWTINPAVTGCSITTGTLNCAFGNFATGASSTVHVTGTTAANSCGTWTNIAKAKADNNAEVSGQASIFVDCATITVTKTAGSATVSAGDPISFTIVVTNDNSGTAHNVTLTDTLPTDAGLGAWTLSGADAGACALSAGVLTCNFGDVIGHGTRTVTLTNTTTAATCGVVSNKAEVSTSNDGKADSTATVTVQCPNLSVTKTPDNAAVNAGDPIGFTMTVHNAGPGVAKSVTLTDTLPAGMTWTVVAPVSGCTITGQALACNLGDLASGADATVHVTATSLPTVCGSITNQATATPTNGAAVTTGTASITVNCADVTVTKTAVSPISAGDTAQFMINVSVTGSGSLSNVTLSDPLPAGVTWAIDPAIDGCSITGSPQSLGCAWPTLAAGTTIEIAVNGTTDLADCAAPLSNTATVAAANETDTTNNTASASIKVDCASIQIEKTASSGTVSAGDPISYTITVTNPGAGTARNVTVTDNLPTNAGLNWTISPAVSGCSIEGTILTCNFGDVPSRGSKSVTLVSPTTGGTCGTVSNTASVTTSNDGAATTPTTEITVQCPHLSVTKTADADTVSAGDTIGFNITVSNAGPGEAKGVTISDTLPGSLAWSVDAANTTATGCSIASGTLTCGPDTLASGSSVKVHVTAVSTSASCSTLSNSATATPTNGAAITSDTATTTVLCPNLSVTKVGNGPISAGDTATFTIEVKNIGAGEAKNVTLSDTLPGGLTWAIDPANAACSITDTTPQTLSCAWATLAKDASVSVSVSAVTTKDNCGTLTNNVTVAAANESSAAASDNTASATLEVDCATIEIAKTTSTPSVSAGDPISYTITVTNPGAGTARDVIVTDSLPSALTWTIDTAHSDTGCSISGTTLTCNFGSVASGGSKSVTITAVTTAGDCGTLSNTASVTTTNDGAKTSDPATEITVLCPHLSVTKTPDAASVSAGDTIGFTITVGNAGPGEAKGVMITDTLPGSLVWSVDAANTTATGCSIASGTLTCGPDTLASGSSVMVHITATSTADSCGTLSNSATATPTNGTAVTSETAAITVLCPDLTVSKEGNGPISAGDTATFTIRVQNTGLGEAKNVSLTDTLPQGVTWALTPAVTGCEITGTTTQTLSCVWATLAAGADITIVVSGKTDAADCATALTNGVSIAASNEANTSNNSDDATIAVECATIQIVKSTTTPSVNAGSPINFTITVTNTGTGTARNVVVTDSLPKTAGLAWAIDPEVSGCTITGDTLTCNFGDIVKEGSQSVTITSPTTAASCGTISNTASVTTTNDGFGESTASVTVNCPDLTVEKTGNGTINAGDTAIYTITVTNNGAGDATNVMLSDQLPAGITWSVDNASCSINSNLLTCNFGILASHASRTIHVSGKALPSTCGLLSNTVDVAATNEAATDNNSATGSVMVNCATIGITKTASSPISAGDTLSYTITVSNTGDGTAYGVTVTDTLPTTSGLGPWVVTPGDPTCKIDAGVLSCTLGDMPTGTSQIITLSSPTTYASCGSIFNEASVATTNDGTSKAGTNVTVNCPALEITKTADADTVSAGDAIGFVITVTNTGDGVAKSVTLGDTLPTGTGISWSIASSDPTCTLTGASLACTFGDLAKGESKSVHVTSPTTAGSCATYDNTATASANNQPTVTSPQASVMVLCSTVQITKVADTGPFSAGDTIGFTIEVFNPGPGTLYGVTVTDTLPTDEGLSWTIAAQPVGDLCSIASGVLTCNFGTMVANTTYSVHITSTTTAATCGTVENTASVTTTNDGSGSAGDALTVSCPDVTVTKTAAIGPFSAVDPISFNITVTNTGTGTARNVTLNDTLPTTDGLSWSVGGTDASACSITAGLVTCDFGDLTSGAVKTITLTSPTTSASCATISNTATVAATNEPSSQPNNSSTASLTVNCPDVTVTKTAVSGTVNAGESISFNITVTNEGAGVAKGVTLSDTLPTTPGLNWSVGGTDAAACSVTAGVVNCDFGDLASGAVKTITLTSPTTKDSCTKINNTATVVAANEPTGQPNNGSTASIDILCASLTITKTAGSDSVNAGEPISFTITVTNNGQGTAKDVIVTDTLQKNPGMGWSASSTNPDGTTGSCAIGTFSGATTETLSCSFDQLTAGQSIVITVTSPTAFASCGTIENTASFTTSNDGSGTSQPATITINCPALTVTKTADAATVSAGSPIGFTITISNAGPGVAKGVFLVDTLPTGSGISWTLDGGTGASFCSVTDGVLDCNFLNMNDGASYTVHVTSPTTALSCGIYPNTVSAISTNHPQIDGTASVTVNCPSLAMTKVGEPSVINAGETARFVITLTNTGMGDAANVVLIDTLPANYDSVSSVPAWDSVTYTPKLDGTTEIRASYNTLAAGASITFTIQLKPVTDVCGIIDNKAAAQASNSNIGVSAEATITVNCPDVTVTKTATSGTVSAGEPISFNITVTNAGAGVAKNVTLSDPLPVGDDLNWSVGGDDGSSCSIATGVLTCNFGDMNPNTVKNITITSPTTKNSCEVYNNIVNVKADNEYTSLDNNNASATVTVLCANIVITKTPDPVSGEINAGDPIAFTITVTNNGLGTAKDISITDILPDKPGLSWSIGSLTAPADTNGSCQVNLSAPQTLTCAFDQLAAGKSITLRVSSPTTLATACTTIGNTASVTTSNDGGAEASASITVTCANIAITKEPVNATVSAGEPIAYDITVTNNGLSTASNLTISDALPDSPGLSWTISNLIAPAGTNGSCQVNLIAPQTLTCVFDQLAAGQSVTVRVSSTTTYASCGTISNIASVTTGNDGKATTPAADISVNCPALEVVKTPDAQTVSAGEPISFTVTVTNTGTGTAKNVTLRDQLPLGITWTVDNSVCGVDANGLLTCDFNDLGPGESADVTFTGNTIPAICGAFDNTATIKLDNGPDIDSNTVNVTVNCSDVTVTKEAVNGTINAGDTAAFKMLVSNIGAGTAYNVTLADTLPAGVTWTIDPAVTGCDITGSTLSCSFASLAAGAIITINVSGMTDAADCGTMSNTATVAANNETNTGNNSSTATITVNCSDLTVTKEAVDGTINAGDTAAFKLVVTNSGAGTAYNVTLTDNLPAGVTWTVNPAVTGCAITGSTLSCSFTTLAAGASVEINVSGTTSPAVCGKLDNLAMVSASNEVNTHNNNAGASIIVNCSDVTVTKEAVSGTINAGDMAAYKIIVTNTGAGTAYDVTLTDVLPAGVTWTIDPAVTGCAITGSTLECSFTTLAAGASVEITVSGATSAAVCGKLDNTVNIAASNEANTGNNSASASITVNCSDITVTKEAVNGTINATDLAAFKIVVSNSGAGTAYDVALTDTLPAGITWTIDPSVTGCAITDNTLSCSFTTLAAGSKVEISVSGTAPVAVCGKLDNTATVTASNETNTTNNSASASITVNCSDVTVSKTALASPINATDTATFKIVVSNNGAGTAYNVTLNDTLPAGGPWAIDPAVTGCTIAGGVLSCSWASLEADASVEIIVKGATSAAICGQLDNTATVAASNEANTSNNSASANIIVNCPDVAVTKAAVSGTINANDTAAFKILVSNTGLGAAYNVTLTDTLPAGVTWTIEPAVTGCSITDNTLSCSWAALAAGASVEITVSGTASPAVCGTLNNSVTIAASNEATTAGGNNSASASITVNCPDVKVTKTAALSTIHYGEEAVFNILVENTGLGKAYNVSLTDTLPGGLTWAIDPAVTGCDITGSVLACSWASLDAGAKVNITVKAATSGPSHCGSLPNTVTIAATNEKASAADNNTSSASITVTCPVDLTISKTADPAFKRTFAWTISKSVDKTQVTQVSGSAAFNYTVNVTETGFTDSDWVVTGKITVVNPNSWIDIPLTDLTDTVNNGGTCTIKNFTTGASIPKGGSVTYDYTCTYTTRPDPYAGVNTATAIWDAAIGTPHGTVSNTANFTFDTGLTGNPTNVNKTVTVTDTFNGATNTLGTVTAVTTQPYTTKSFTYTRSIAVTLAPCKFYTNTAKIVETGQTASQTVTVCGPVKTGALTIGYWQNKNGQSLITKAGAVSGVCKLTSYLRRFAPFQDLSASANCNAVAAYVTKIIKAANASGASMNTMLKAQMLATALDVYFSDPTLGGNKIGAPAPIGGITIDLTNIHGTLDVSAAFGGATSMKVMDMLTYAASKSNVGGTMWYDNVKTTQGLAKDAFDAINNQWVFAP